MERIADIGPYRRADQKAEIEDLQNKLARSDAKLAELKASPAAKHRRHMLLVAAGVALLTGSLVGLSARALGAYFYGLGATPSKPAGCQDELHQRDTYSRCDLTAQSEVVNGQLHCMCPR